MAGQRLGSSKSCPQVDCRLGSALPWLAWHGQVAGLPGSGVKLDSPLGAHSLSALASTAPGTANVYLCCFILLAGGCGMYLLEL